MPKDGFRELAVKLAMESEQLISHTAKKLIK